MNKKLDSEHEIVVLDDGAIKIFRSDGSVIALNKEGTIRLADFLNSILSTAATDRTGVTDAGFSLTERTVRDDR